MTPEEIHRFHQPLLAWFDVHQRVLPWRRTRDPYHIWVSEVMLQQTRVTKVLTYYEAFVRRFPNVRALADADLEVILKFWERLGYYARARNLHKAARIIQQRMSGEIPAQYDRFRALPGVGDYIAAAVQSMAFNMPYAVVDGNVKRVISRLLLMDSSTDTASAQRFFRETAAHLLARDRPGPFNQAMMELGATICRPRHPACPECPVRPFCRAYLVGRQHEIPLTKRAKSVPRHHIATGIVYKNSRILITRRAPDGLLGGLWEFPGGKVRRGETAEEACVREIKEEVNLSVTIRGFLTQIKHAYSHFKIVMDVFWCRYDFGHVVLNGPVDHRWITPDQIDQFPFPAGTHKFIPLLRSHMK